MADAELELTQRLDKRRRFNVTHRAAQLDDPGLDLVVGKAGVEFLVQQGDDFCRGVLGRADARKLWLANIATQRLDSIGALEGYSVNKRRFSTLLP